MGPTDFSLLSILIALVHTSSQTPLQVATKITIAPSSTSRTPSPVYTNTWAYDCNVEGSLPSSQLASVTLSNYNGSGAESSILDCQSDCDVTTNCQAFSYFYNLTTSLIDCHLYQNLNVYSGHIIPGHTGLFFSDRSYLGPSCYSGTPITSPPSYDLETPVYIKTWLRDCHLEAAPTDSLGDQYSFPENNILDCQTRCYYTSPCISWAWNSTAPGGSQCVWWDSWIDPYYFSGVITLDNSSAIFFSDRIPADDSDSCYSDKPIPLPSSIVGANATGNIYAKTWLEDCVIQGSPTPELTACVLGDGMGGTTEDMLECQGSCRGTTACFSWAWNSTGPGHPRCIFYNSQTHSAMTPDRVVKGDTGVFFSNKYPTDGSDFCVSSNPITSPAADPQSTTTLVAPSTLQTTSITTTAI